MTSGDSYQSLNDRNLSYLSRGTQKQLKELMTEAEKEKYDQLFANVKVLKKNYDNAHVSPAYKSLSNEYNKIVGKECKAEYDREEERKALRAKFVRNEITENELTTALKNVEDKYNLIIKNFEQDRSKISDKQDKLIDKAYIPSEKAEIELTQYLSTFIHKLSEEGKLNNRFAGEIMRDVDTGNFREGGGVFWGYLCI